MFSETRYRFVYFVQVFTLTITSISFMKTRLIRTAINTADTNVIQSVIIVILLSKFSLIYLPY